MAFQGDSIFWVEVNKIVPNPFQPRREFDESKLKELSESIRMYGILQPLTVTRKEIQGDNGAFRTEYELIAGERRLRASHLAKLEQVPVIIRDGEDTEQEKLELAIIENLQREDLNAVDRALAFQQLADTFNLSHVEVAKKVGRSREYVSNTIRLLGLPRYMLDSLKTGDITEGHARTLLMLKDRVEEQDVVYREILLKKLSVREVERIVRKIATDKVRKQKWKDTDPQLIEFEKEFTDALGTRVQIAKTDYGGKLTIDYFSEEDLEKLLVQLTAQAKERGPKPEVPVVTAMSEVDGAAFASVMAATPLVAKEDDVVESSNLDKDLPETKTEVVEEAEVVEEVVPVEEKTELVSTEQLEPEEIVEEAVDEVAAASQVRSEMVVTKAVDENVSSPARLSIRDQISQLLHLEQRKSEEVVTEDTVVDDTSVTEQKNKNENDDDDLYAMKNFSL